MIKVIIVDDHELLFDLFKVAFASDHHYEIIGTIKDASLAPSIVSSLSPDLVIMDVLTANNSNGIEATKIIKKEDPHIKIVILTGFNEISILHEAKEAKADSFVYKDTPLDEMMDIINRTMKGEHVYPCEKSNNFLPDNLTKRELEILACICEGDTRKQISEKLSISEDTVKTHISSLLTKTGQKTRAQLAIYAIKAGQSLAPYKK